MAKKNGDRLRVRERTIVGPREIDTQPLDWAIEGPQGSLAARVPVTAIAREPICLRPELTLEATAQLFLDRGISGAPVVDERGAVLGVLSKTDLTRNRSEWRGAPAKKPLRAKRGRVRERLGKGFHLDDASTDTVGACMSVPAYSVSEAATIADAAALMAEKSIHRVPVVDGEQRVVGIISALDVLAWLARFESSPNRSAGL